MKSLPKIALLATVSSLALAGTASAAVTGLEINTTKSEFNSLFAKLGLSEEPDIHRRVKAVLLYLAEHHTEGG